MIPRALITGSLRGLGFEIAKKLSMDFRLIMSGRIDEPEFLKRLSNDRIEFEAYHKIDFSEEPRKFLRNVEKIPAISLLIHNAAPYTEDRFFKTTNEQVISFGTFMTNSILLIRNIRFSEPGKLILVGSSAADRHFKGYAGGAMYVTYKSSLQGLADALIKEADLNTIVVNPGLISNETPCPDDAVSSTSVIDAIQVAATTNRYDRQIISIYPKMYT